MRMRKSMLGLVVCIAVLMLTLGVPTAAARGTSGPATAIGTVHTIVVRPTGGDDTANIQAAFNTCTSHGWTCAIQLVKGTYHTSQIAVFGFRGSFVGAGQGKTTVQGNPSLASPTADPFWAASPGPSNPWPALFTFENGTFQISGMTLTDPYAAPTQGWDWPDVGTVTALYAAIEVTGLYAYVTVDHVTVLGASGDNLGTNMATAIYYDGTILPAGWSDPYASVVALTGTITVTNSVFNSVTDGLWAELVTDATIIACYNTFVNSPAPLGFNDVPGSQVVFCGNSIPNQLYYGAFEMYESDIRPATLPTTVYILDNYIQMSQGATAIYLLDFGPSGWGVPSTLNGVISGNLFVTDTSCGCYVGSDPFDYSVMVTDGLASLVVSQNTVVGGGSAGVYVIGGPATVRTNAILGSYIGVWVDSANGVSVLGNGIKNSAEYGIAVTGSSNSVVAYNLVMNSGAYDLYWDETGTGNVWSHNSCQTSSPAGLC